MSSDESLDSYSSQRGESKNMSKSNASKETHARLVRRWKFSPLSSLNILISSDFSTSVPSPEEVPYIGQTRDKANHIGGIVQSNKRLLSMRMSIQWYILDLVTRVKSPLGRLT